MRLKLGRGTTTLIGLALALGPAAASVGGVAIVAEDDAWTVLEDQTLEISAPGVLGNDSAPVGTKCVTGEDTTGLQGALGSGVAEDGSFAFTPDPDWNGETSFTYDLAADTSGGCPASVDDTATVTLTVTAVNDAPTAALAETCDGGVTVAEDSGAYTDTGHCAHLQSLGPADESAQGLDAWVVSSNHPELFSVTPSLSIVDSTFGRLQFTPAPNAHGSATVTVRGRDSGGTANGGENLSPAVQFTLTITAQNDPPTATADSFFALKDRTLNVGVPGVLINDGDIDSGSITAVLDATTTHGILTLAANGSFSYTPAAGYTGPDAFSYHAFDGSLSSPIRVVSLTVTAIPPVATPTPIPTPTLPPGVTPEPTLTEPLPSSPIDPAATPGPFATPQLTAIPSGAASLAPSLAPGETPGPTAPAAGGGLSLPVLLVLVLFALLVGFGAALYLPKWLKARNVELFREDEP